MDTRIGDKEREHALHIRDSKTVFPLESATINNEVAVIVKVCNVIFNSGKYVIMFDN